MCLIICYYLEYTQAVPVTDNYLLLIADSDDVESGKGGLFSPCQRHVWLSALLYEKYCSAPKKCQSELNAL